MIEKVKEKRMNSRDCVGWLCYVLSSEGTNSGQLSSLRKQSVDSPSPVSWWLIARVEHNKLHREINLNTERSWHMLVKALALLTLSGTPVKSNTAAPSEASDASKDQDVLNHAPDVPLRGSLHRPDRALGAALFAAGYSEHRLATLLNARDVQLEEALIRTCRFLLAKKEAFDCRELADLIFLQNPITEQHDQVRQKIARAYFRSAVKKDSKLSEIS